VDASIRVVTDVKRAVVGLDGKFGESSWGWDGYYQYGLTNREQYVNDNRHLIAYLMATDAVAGPGGTIQCRVTRDGYATAAAFNPAYANVNPALATGCVPLSAFGSQPLSQAAHDYSFGFLDENLRYEQQVVALNASGDLFAGFGAGAIQGAIGFEYRTEKGENIAAKGQEIPDYVRIDYATQYGESFAGDVDVTEGFFELNLPVLSHVPGAQKLEFNLAARESKYDNQGKEGTDGTSKTHNLFTWKAQGLWDPIDWLRVRATQSRDARAANFRELYYGQIISPGGTFGYCSPVGTTTDPCLLDFRGNVNLEPEKSDTTTLGLVFSPKDWAAGLQVAVDYFKIDVKDSINQGSSRVVLDGCNNGLGDPQLCAQITTAIPGNYTDVISLRGLSYNGKGYTYKGVDFTANYLWELNDTSNMNFRLLGTHMLKQQYQQTGALPVYNVVGQTGTANSFLSDNQPSAKWLANLSSTYNQGPFSLTGQVRYVSSGTFNSRGIVPGDPAFPLGIVIGGAAISSNHVPSYEVFTLSSAYTFDHLFGTSSVQLFGVVNNLFDKDPPVAVGNGANQNGGTNPVFFDTMGRAYRVGFRAAF
jgi:outer membrane receptor protein involved in Fe transport